MRKIGRKEAKKSRGFSNLWMGIIDIFQIEGKNVKTRKIENQCQSEEGSLAWDGNFVWASGSGRGEVCGSRKKFSWGERGTERGTGLLRKGGSAELGQAASGSATQAFGWETEK